MRIIVTRLKIIELLKKTKILEGEAGDAGDTFLQYLYRMAILHLELHVGISSEKDILGQPREVDPEIGWRAARLVAITREIRRKP